MRAIRESPLQDEIQRKAETRKAPSGRERSGARALNDYAVWCYGGLLFDLSAFKEASQGRAATLLVSERETQRYLLFDDDMRLVGWTNVATGEVRSPYTNLDPSLYKKYAFAGVHYMNPSLFSYFDSFPDKFSIIDFYLKVCSAEPIYGYVQPNLRLLDVGKLDSLDAAEIFVKE